MAVTRLLCCLPSVNSKNFLGELLTNPDPCIRFVVARSLLLLNKRYPLLVFHYITKDGKNAAQVYGETLLELPAKPKRGFFERFGNSYPYIGFHDCRFAYVPLLAEFKETNPAWRHQLDQLRNQARDATVRSVVSRTEFGLQTSLEDDDRGFLMFQVEHLIM